jgi:hypothetical protein
MLSALVATAGGAEQDDALAKLRHIEQARDEVIHLLQDTPFGSADLAVIRHALDSLETAALDAEEHVRREDFPGAQTGGRHVGSAWLELKYIPDAASSRTYGPYIYLQTLAVKGPESRLASHGPVAHEALPVG